MATNYIPKIEWLTNDQQVDTVLGSPTLINIPDTTAIEVGMYASGTGIPTDARVQSKTVSTVTLDLNATASATITANFIHRITFEYPPKKDTFGEEIRQAGKVLVAKSGEAQFLTDHIQRTSDLKMSFVSQTIKDELDTFFINHGYRGFFFDWYEDKDDVATKRTVQIDFRSLKTKPKVITRKGAGFLWEVRIKIREVIA